MKILDFVESCGNCTYYKKDWRGELTDIHDFVLETLSLGIVLLLLIILIVNIGLPAGIITFEDHSYVGYR
jgi:hypothetical protein